VSLGPFYVGQVPADTLVLTVTTDGTTVKPLTAYTGATIVMTDPDGLQVTTAGAVTLDKPNGKVMYTWPGTSHFAKVGQYKVQPFLTGAGGVNDPCTPVPFQVEDPLP